MRFVLFFDPRGPYFMISRIGLITPLMLLMDHFEPMNTAGYRIPGLIYGRIPYTWPDIRQDTVYLAWYTAGYRIPGLVYGRIPYTWPDIRPDTVYLA